MTKSDTLKVRISSCLYSPFNTCIERFSRSAGKAVAAIIGNRRQIAISPSERKVTQHDACDRRKPPLVGLEHVLTGAKKFESLARNGWVVSIEHGHCAKIVA